MLLMQTSDHANPPCLPWRHCGSTEPAFEHLLLTVLESDGSISDWESTQTSIEVTGNRSFGAQRAPLARKKSR